MNILDWRNKFIYSFIIIGALVYFPIFFNGFVWDDLYFIVNNPEVHKFNIVTLLGNNMFNEGSFYRPIPAIYFAAIYSFFGQQAIVYHLLQIFLHLICSYLLFVFFRMFFGKGLSFFLSLIFLVHPINVESVALVGFTQSELFFLPGISSLLLAGKEHLSTTRFILISALIFVSIMTKETGFLFIPLIFALRYMLKLNKFKQFLISSSVIIVLYFLIRLFVGGVTKIIHEGVNEPITGLPIWQRLLHIPTIVLYYLKTFLFPIHLSVMQKWTLNSITFYNFTIPLIVECLLLILALGAIFVMYRNEKRQSEALKNRGKHIKVIMPVNSQLFSFFFLWFVLGMSLILQIFPLDMTVADRWFYFPIAGLLGMIGVGLEAWLRSGRRIIFYNWIAVIIVILLSARTFARTSDYHDNITLYTHDLNVDKNNLLMINELANELFDAGRIDEAIAYQKEGIAVSPTYDLLNGLGLSYQGKKQYEEASTMFMKAIKVLEGKSNQYKSISGAYVNMASNLLLLNRPEDVVKFINGHALKKRPDNPHLYASLAIAESKLGNQKKAIEAASRAYRLSPDEYTKTIYDAIKNNIPINVE